MDDSTGVAMRFPSPVFGGGWPEGSGGGCAEPFIKEEFFCNFNKFNYTLSLLQHFNPTHPFGAPSPEIRGGKLELVSIGDSPAHKGRWE